MSDWQIVADRDQGDDPQPSDVREGDRVTTIASWEGSDRTGRALIAKIIRIERQPDAARSTD